MLPQHIISGGNRLTAEQLEQRTLLAGDLLSGWVGGGMLGGLAISASVLDTVMLGFDLNADAHANHQSVGVAVQTGLQTGVSL